MCKLPKGCANKVWKSPVHKVQCSLSHALLSLVWEENVEMTNLVPHEQLSENICEHIVEFRSPQVIVDRPVQTSERTCGQFFSKSFRSRGRAVCRTLCGGVRPLILKESIVVCRPVWLTFCCSA